MMWWGGRFPECVPVSKRIARARKAAEKLRKKGVDIQPVEFAGNKIAASFWGKSWCEHMDSFHDYANRLPRGRSYVRNGSVVHLDVSKGKIAALVAGSETYTVEVHVKLLPAPRWERIKEQCAGQIASLMDLLKGKLSDGVMRVVSDRTTGLFPGPKEITMRCSCPDIAGMCKHIAAVFYGVGARLDTRPELLFLLRGVDHAELATQGSVDAVIDRGRGTEGELSGADLSEVFGIELLDDGMVTAAIPKAAASPKAVAKSKAPKIAKPGARGKAAVSLKPQAAPSGKQKPKASKKSPASRKSRSVLKTDEQRLDRVLQLVRSYVAGKRKTGKKIAALSDADTKTQRRRGRKPRQKAAPAPTAKGKPGRKSATGVKADKKPRKDKATDRGRREAMFERLAKARAARVAKREAMVKVEQS